MKVSQNPLNNAQSLENAKSVDKAQQHKKPAHAESASKPAAQDGASVHISDQAKLMQKATEVVASTPDVRADKVADIKSRILQGSYQVDAQSIADRLIEEHFLSDFGKNNL